MNCTHSKTNEQNFSHTKTINHAGNSENGKYVNMYLTFINSFCLTDIAAFKCQVFLWHDNAVLQCEVHCSSNTR